MQKNNFLKNFKNLIIKEKKKAINTVTATTKAPIAAPGPA